MIILNVTAVNQYELKKMKISKISSSSIEAEGEKPETCSNQCVIFLLMLYFCHFQAIFDPSRPQFGKKDQTFYGFFSGNLP